MILCRQDKNGHNFSHGAVFFRDHVPKHFRDIRTSGLWIWEQLFFTGIGKIGFRPGIDANRWQYFAGCIIIMTFSSSLAALYIYIYIHIYYYNYNYLARRRQVVLEQVVSSLNNSVFYSFIQIIFLI